jgi:heme/copper-type cytochrome/quinol oxidase subunit 2
MTPESYISKRLVGLFLLGFVLFNYPVISLFNIDKFWFGIPILYLYVFGVWFILVMLIVLITKFNHNNSQHTPPPYTAE